MKIALDSQDASAVADASSISSGIALKTWLTSWEMYFIVGLAAFLRLFLINTTEFDDDQAIVFRMAHDAIAHHLFVATSNVASIRIVNPPGVIYVFMLAAAFSANPLGGVILVGLCNAFAVLLTYIFTRRYYGRLAAIIASLLFATAMQAVYYSRFIWQQNLLPLFVMLFLFALFAGVVGRRKGWLFPSLVLLGFLVQLHASTVLLSAALLVALLLSPGTLRWRDLAFGLLGVLIIYFPYLLWEVATKFSDVYILLNATKHKTVIDTVALSFYQLFLSPYNPQSPPTNPHLLLHAALPWLLWLPWTMTILAICGGLSALVQSIWSWTSRENTNFLRALRNWWRDLRSSPYRCGLLILLAWQLLPLLYLSRDSLNLFPHYFIFFMPGQFILIGLLLAQLADWFPRFKSWGLIVRFDIILLVACILIAQFAGTLANVLDYGLGNYSDTQLGYPYYNDLSWLQGALHDADQVAMHNHLNHVYITTDFATQTAMRYLAEQMHTPTTLFDASSCLALPGPASGPAVMLIGPHNTFAEAMLTHFATAKLVDEPLRPGSLPFHLYIVRPPVQAATATVFAHNLRLLSMSQQVFAFNNAPWYVTRWRLLRSAAPSYRTTYTYQMQATPDGDGHLRQGSQCILTSMRSGDQLLFAFRAALSQPLPETSVMFTAQFYQSAPYNLKYGPITLETDRNINTQSVDLGVVEERLTTAYAIPRVAMSRASARHIDSNKFSKTGGSTGRASARHIDSNKFSKTGGSTGRASARHRPYYETEAARSCVSRRHSRGDALRSPCSLLPMQNNL